MPLEFVSQVEDDEVTLTPEEVEEDPKAEEAETPEEAEDESEDEADEAESDDVAIGFEDEESAERESPTDTPVIRGLREQNKQLVRQLRGLEKRLKEPTEKAEVEEVGPEPTFEACDWDEAVFKAKWAEWNGRKAAAAERQKQKQEAERQANEAYQKKLDAYKAAAATLGVKDYEDAEASVRDALSPTQQSILVKHMAQGAALVYALSKSPAKLKELSAIADPIEFALAAKQLEDKVKVVKSKTVPPPERALRGSAKVSAGSAAKHLEALQAEADRTGDRSKVAAFLRQQRAREQ